MTATKYFCSGSLETHHFKIFRPVMDFPLLLNMFINFWHHDLNSKLCSTVLVAFTIPKVFVNFSIVTRSYYLWTPLIFHYLLWLILTVFASFPSIWYKETAAVHQAPYCFCCLHLYDGMFNRLTMITNNSLYSLGTGTDKTNLTNLK